SRRSSRGLLELDRQCLEATEGADSLAPGHRVRCEPHVRYPFDDRGERDLCHEPREWRAETVVPGPAERELTTIRSSNVEAIRIREVRGIAIRRGQHGDDGLARANGPAAELVVAGCDAGGVLDRA